MKCKDCDACHKGYFKSKPDDYVCIGVCEPFVINNIDNECTEYSDFKKSELWSWNEVNDDNWTHGTFNSREEALNDAICSIEDVRSYLETDDPTIYLGRCKYVPLRTDVDVERILEYLDEAYCEDTGCENYIYNGVTDEQFKWLEDKFAKVMEEFHKMANINPSWFNVTEIEEINLNEYVKRRKKIDLT